MAVNRSSSPYKLDMNNINHNRGFTLTEIVVSVGIFSFIIIGIGTFSGDVFRYNRVVSNSISAQQDARQILRKFANELRTAQASANGSFALAEVGDNALTFFSDVDKDGTIEQVRYYMSGTDLLRSTIEPSGVPAVYTATPVVVTLIRNLMNGGTPVFTYFDANYSGSGSALSQPVNANTVRLVKINLVIEQDLTQAPVPITVTTQVSIRNLKDNL